MTFRHLFRSHKLTTLTNRFGHIENYRFSLELDNAIAQALQEDSNHQTTQIVLDPSVPAVFHSEFDNFDQFLCVFEDRGISILLTA